VVSPGRFSSGERASRTHRIVGWVGPTGDLMRFEEGKNLLPLLPIETKFGFPVHISVTTRTTLSRIELLEQYLQYGGRS